MQWKLSNKCRYVNNLCNTSQLFIYNISDIFFFLLFLKKIRNYVELMESTIVNLIQVIDWHIAEQFICWKKIVRKNEPLVHWMLLSRKGFLLCLELVKILLQREKLLVSFQKFQELQFFLEIFYVHSTFIDTIVQKKLEI